jgi:hypothetical protein
MRKTTVALLAVLLVTLVTLPALAGDMKEMKAESWTGWITDSHCGAKGANAQHTRACVEKCAKGDGKVVFYNNGDQKLYELDKTDKALENVGHEVVITGHLDGGKIKVEKIEKKA